MPGDNPDNANAGGSSSKIAGIKLPDRLLLGADATNNWKIFKQRWTTYSIITDSDAQPLNKQVATFLYCLSDEALEAYNTFELADTATLADIIKEFDKFIVGEANETYERYCFNRRNQEEDEHFELFYADLQRLLKTCNYCDSCKPSILRDRILLGTADTSARNEMLKIRDLTLTKAIDICKSYEKAQSQSKALTTSVNKVRTSKQSTSKQGNVSRTKFAKSKNSNSNEAIKMIQKCKFCGSSHEWNKLKCPAFQKQCTKCLKFNHFANVCTSSSKNSKSVNYLNEPSETDSERSELEWINQIAKKDSKQVKCLMKIGSYNVKFQIDSGSSVNILPVNFVDNEKINPTSVTLTTWNNKNYVPLGESRLITVNPKNKKKYSVNYIICHEQFTPILGLKASEQMKMLEIKNETFHEVYSLNINNYESVFRKDAVGSFTGRHSLKLREDAIPTMMADRRVPAALKKPLKEELQRLTELKVITPVEEPTEWVSQPVIVKKSDNSIRLCLDPHELNKYLVREKYTIPTLDEITHNLKDATIFSKVDLASGYWHIKLDENSSKLTTFQTCFGRFRWLRLPFGLNVSSEIFQRKLLEAISGLSGVICIADDIIIYGSNDAEHDLNMENFLKRCRDTGIKLNKSKMDLKVKSLTFMGHKITEKGLEIDPKKLEAINAFKTPTNVSELKSFLGMINYVSKFVPNLSSSLYPLNNLLKKNVTWSWSSTQVEAFAEVKKLLCNSVTLSYHDPEKELTLENDACEYGLGSVLYLDGNKPLYYASRTLTESERRYSQIEKETLAIVFGLKKFHYYIYGRKINITTDHKPLLGIFNKPLSKCPKRIQSLVLKCQEYDFNLTYKPGNSIPVADALSRSPAPVTEVVHTVNNLEDGPLKHNRFLEIKEATEKDKDLQEVIKVISKGWPENKNYLHNCVLPYFSYRDEMTIEDGLVLRGERIVIPAALRHSMKEKVHAGHLGINSCLRRARTTIFWPGMSADIRRYVESCRTCATFQPKQPSQPLHMHDVPNRPWKKIGMDLFHIKGRNYLITVDYYSQYFEVDFLQELSTFHVITKLKAHLARFGLPEKIIVDNGPQFSNHMFKNFCSRYQIKLQPISPGNSKANGAAEAAVKIAKNLMKKAQYDREDPYIALLNYRNTPQEGLNSSPVQRLMGRRTNTLVPTKESLLQPKSIDSSEFITRKEDMKYQAAEKHRTQKELPPLSAGTPVRMQPIRTGQTEWKEATVTKQLSNRSYTVEGAEGRSYVRDRKHLRPDNSSNPKMCSPEKITVQSQDCPISKPKSVDLPSAVLPNVADSSINSEAVKTRSGRTIRKPSRYQD